MRDPYAPIPTNARWWARAPVRPPPPPGHRRDGHRSGEGVDPTTFDPLSLLDPTGDRLGLDRRRRARGAHGPSQPEPEPDLALADVVSAGHIRVRRVLGLLAGTTAPSLVQAVSWCPHGILARAIDPTDKHASTRGRAMTHRAFRTLVPELARGAASPLFAAGVAVLSARVVRDLAEAASRRLTVQLVVPRHPDPSARRPVRERPALRITGTLAPLTDPQPELLAIALAAADAAALRELWLARAAP